MKITKNKGVALILSVIILTAVLAIALTAGKIFTDKIKMSRNTSDSMKAYYAAESGIEYALYQIKTTPSWTPTADCSVETNWTEIDGAKYCLEKTGDSIKAIGKAGEARRGIEVQVAQAAAGESEPSLLLSVSDFSAKDDIDRDTFNNVMWGKHIVEVDCGAKGLPNVRFYNPQIIYDWPFDPDLSLSRFYMVPMNEGTFNVSPGLTGAEIQCITGDGTSVSGDFMVLEIWGY